MNLFDVIRDVRRLLAENGRVSQRMLRKQFQLDDQALDELVEELVEVQRVAALDGAVLVHVQAGAAPAVMAADTPVAPAVPLPRDRAPSSYTPKHLADKILQSRSALEGERKQVTVLFADVKGSMELAEQLDPEEWHSILERFFAILTEGVHRFEGTVNQYTGDGIMALFGAPIAHEDHAQRACYAALQLRENLRDFARDLKRQHGIDFATRIGLNSGDVVVGRIGDDLRMDYTAQGHTVGLAQRMESLAASGCIYVSADTARLVHGYFELEDLGAFNVKGVNPPVHVHELKQVGSARSRFDISRSRGFSRFVGRSADLRTLEDALALSTAGNGQVIGVVAEAGTGKSRLCFEFLESCRARGLQVFEARAVSHGKNIPLLPILELFRAYFGITTQDDERSTREKIAGRMMVLDRTFADTLPLVYDFLGVSDPQNPAPELGAEARQRQLLAVMRQVIKSASQTRPIITLIEDLHWLDTSSAEFLEHLVDAREGSRSLLLLNFRPEYQAEWMQKSWYRQIPLTPLGRDAIAELLADLLGTHPSTSDLVSPIHTRTGGNPFFTEEVVQSLIESGHLQGSRSAYQLITTVERLDVPPTVQAVLAARIDRLPEREKQLLQVASVIGKDFTETLLADVAGLPVDELKSALAALRRAEFILELSIYPVIEYTFKHPLTQEVALHSQLQTRRRQVHAAVAQAIERQDADHLDERAALLAQHWDVAGEALLAARWYRRAAEWMGSTDLTAATRNWQKARLLQRQVRGNREAAEIGLAACRQVLANLSFRLAADLDEARAVFAEGQALAESLGDRDEALNLSIHFSRVLSASLDVAGCVQLAFENHRAARSFADVALQINADTYLMDALHLSGRYPEVLALTQEWQDRVPRDLPRETWLRGINPYTFLRMFESLTCAFLGHLPLAIEHCEQVQVLVTEDRTPEIAGFNWAMQAEFYYLAGDRAGALTSAGHAIAASERMPDNLSLTGYAQLALALASQLTGQPTRAVEAAERSLHYFQEADTCYAGKAAAFLAVALLEAGDLPAAGAAAKHAIELCRRSLRAVYEAIAHGVRALVMIRLEGAVARDRIETELTLADDLIERFGTRTLVPSLLEWRAELAAALGDSGERHRLLAAAQARYVEVGAPLQAERIARLAGAASA